MLNIKPDKPILVLGAHPDDELGCGATISRLIEEGHEVYHYYLSPCEQSLKDIGLPPEQLQRECNLSRSILGISLDNCGNYNFPVRYFPTVRQDILEEFTKLRRQINPGLVFVPNSNDIHQDHHCVYKEAVRAFKHSSILGYELPWNTLTMNHDCLVVVQERHLQRKLKALQAYESQMQRVYANTQFFRSLAEVRGVQANVQYAECFEVIRIIF
jgi:LmbE family N-acetylglucosaminyl deacetylase